MSQESLTPEQTTELLQWRDRKLSPKEIARQMGLRPAIVSEFLRGHTELLAQERQEKGELAPLVGCSINQGAIAELLEPKRNIFGKKKSSDDSKGMAQITVARMEKNRYLVSSFLIDYFCLGVKNALLKKCDRAKYEMLMQATSAGFGEELQEISLEQAQAIIFGSIDYAASLGFQPHPDFEEAKFILGPRLEKLQKIECGRSGKPFYIEGPRDNSGKIIRTLRESVGDGNFDYMAGVPAEFF
ncbi:MAG: DNA-binding response regulator [Alkalinema sp. RU_4_3]|nr:DNA-binding response regulator [Alkalinema sp. RU_4_3]